jgi:hypothetical protein
MSNTENEKTAAEAQNEAEGGVEAIVDAGPGYPQIVGQPTADAIAGTPLDPQGHDRIAEEAGRTTGVAYEEPSDPIHLDDPENTAEVNKAALKDAGADVGTATSKETRGPKEPKKS